jgi:hypothetical protein
MHERDTDTMIFFKLELGLIMFLLAVRRHFTKTTTSIELVGCVHCILHCVSKDEEF